MTILYAAMAVEVAVNTKLEEVYMQAIQSSPSDLRIVRIPQSGGQVIIKDPIYESLSGGTSFPKALHERPLYLLKKSLMLEDDVLYKTAIKLYKTRNKIAHHGASPTTITDDNHFAMDYSSALEALRGSTEIFRWFGINESYIVPSKGFYQICKWGDVAEYRNSLSECEPFPG